jgi:hypothetical protein
MSFLWVGYRSDDIRPSFLTVGGFLATIQVYFMVNFYV